MLCRIGLVLALGLATGCTSDRAPRPATTRSAPASARISPGSEAAAGVAVACAHDLGVTAPVGPGYRIVLDAVALPAGTLEPQPSGAAGWHFAKHGLLVRAGTAVEIAVAPEAAGGVRIGWGSPGVQGTRIRVPACPSGSAWLAFAGGYTVREPACVPLVVRAHGRRERVRVSVGSAC